MERRRFAQLRLPQRKAGFTIIGNRDDAETVDTGQLSSHVEDTIRYRGPPDSLVILHRAPSAQIPINATSNTLPASIPYANDTKGSHSTSKLISVTTDALSEPLTKFTIFPKLPLELRFKIYNLSLEPQDVYISRSRKWESRQAICMVCKEAKQEYERQYKILKKRPSEFRPRFGPIFVNYSIDYVHFFHTSFEERITWAGIMATKMRYTFDLVGWLKPAQKVAIRLRQKGGNRGLYPPKPKYEHVWEYFNRVCPHMKQLVFIICHRKFPIVNLVELKDFGGDIGEGEINLRASFKAAQQNGFNTSARLIVMGSPLEWVISEGKLVELVDVSK
ncbi:hypothetical protein DL98DRAFT_523515 [Cadophora sp. DSE1049]|nr:hypothetical protein DL98DRAFT_523515 [Cadophora sp. DSE1049]